MPFDSWRKQTSVPHIRSPLATINTRRKNNIAHSNIDSARVVVLRCIFVLYVLSGIFSVLHLLGYPYWDICM